MGRAGAVLNLDVSRGTVGFVLAERFEVLDMQAEDCGGGSSFVPKMVVENQIWSASIVSAGWTWRDWRLRLVATYKHYSLQIEIECI